MVQQLETNAKVITTLLASIGQSPLSAKDTDTLNHYTISVNGNKEIVFTVFLNKFGEPASTYVNDEDSKIISNIENSDQSLLEVEMVIEAAKHDPTVLIHEQSMEYYGLPIGKIIVGIDKTSMIIRKLRCIK